MSKLAKNSKRARLLTSNDKHKKLVKKVIDSKAYLNPNISLKMVADMLGILPRYLTVLVSQTEGCNFATFISKHRIAYSAKLLLSKEDLTIKEVAEESGFSNISTFQRSFRAYYGVCPGAYRQSEGITADLLTLINKMNYEEFTQILLKAFPRLSPRELKICHLSCQGTTPEQQADAIGTTKDTIEVTRSRLRRKLGLRRTDHVDMKVLSVLRDHLQNGRKE